MADVLNEEILVDEIAESYDKQEALLPRAEIDAECTRWGNAMLKRQISGTGLGVEMCINECEEGGIGDKICKTVGGIAYNIRGCNAPEQRVIKNKIDNLPVFLVIGHSSYDIYAQMDESKAGGEQLDIKTFNKQTKGAEPIDFLLPAESDIAKCKFVVYPVPAGAWGMLAEGTGCEGNDHFLNKTNLQLKDFLFDPNIPYYRRINIHEESEDLHRRWYKRAESTHPAFFIPGSNVLEKGHQMFGNIMTGHGFGIIRLNRTNRFGDEDYRRLTAEDLLQTRADEYLDSMGESLADTDATEISDNCAEFGGSIPRDVVENRVYFLSDDELTEGDIAVKKYIQDKTARCNQIWMSEIVRQGDPGIYISLACASTFPYLKNREDGDWVGLQALGGDGVTTDADKNGSFYYFINQLTTTINNKIAPANGVEWDSMCNKIQYSRRRRGEGEGADEDAPGAAIMSADRDDKTVATGSAAIQHEHDTRAAEKKKREGAEQLEPVLDDLEGQESDRTKKSGRRRSTRRRKRRDFFVPGEGGGRRTRRKRKRGGKKGTRVYRCVHKLKKKYSIGKSIAICQKSTQQGYKSGKKLSSQRGKRGGRRGSALIKKYGRKRGKVIPIYGHKIPQRIGRHRFYILWKTTKKNLPGKTYHGRFYSSRKQARRRRTRKKTS